MLIKSATVVLFNFASKSQKAQSRALRAAPGGKF